MLDQIEQEARIEKLYAELEEIRRRRLNDQAEADELEARRRLNSAQIDLVQLDVKKRDQDVKLGVWVALWPAVAAISALFGSMVTFAAFLFGKGLH